MKSSIWIGFDPREASAFAVARASAARYCARPIPIHGLVLADLVEAGLYKRPTERRDGRLYDVISEHPMATEFAISRFLVPYMTDGWALFMDCDMLVRGDLTRLFRTADPDKAVHVVKHNHDPVEATKMDGQVQSRYARKNWSSVMLFNCDHPSNRNLTPELVNSVPGRDLHRFCWLDDDEIGELPVEYNWLVGHSPHCWFPRIVHFTDGIPTMPGYENCDYADEWRDVLASWAANPELKGKE